MRIPWPLKGTIVLQQVDMGVKDGLPDIRFENDHFAAKAVSAADLKRIRADKGKYHLVYLGRKPVTESARIQLATVPKVKGNPGRSAAIFLGSLWDEKKPKQEFDFYLSLKDGGDGKSLLVDRMVAAKVRPGTPKPENK